MIKNNPVERERERESGPGESLSIILSGKVNMKRVALAVASGELGYIFPHQIYRPWIEKGLAKRINQNQQPTWTGLDVGSMATNQKSSPSILRKSWHFERRRRRLAKERAFSFPRLKGMRNLVFFITMIFKSRGTFLLVATGRLSLCLSTAKALAHIKKNTSAALHPMMERTQRRCYGLRCTGINGLRYPSKSDGYNSGSPPSPRERKTIEMYRVERRKRERECLPIPIPTMIRPARRTSLPSAAPITTDPTVKTTLAAIITGLLPNRSTFFIGKEKRNVE